MMCVRSSGFATLLVLTLLMPLSTLLFHFWHTVSIHHELMIQRQHFYEEVQQLEGVLAMMVKQFKKDHHVIWEKLDRLTQLLTLPLVLKQQEGRGRYEETKHFRLIIDKLPQFEQQQIRICVQLLTSHERVKRSISCLLTRQQLDAKKEGYAFVVDYFTLGRIV